MPVTSVAPDPDALSLTVVADFTVPVARLWEAYADPRQLERFWGPPLWPATFTRHDMTVGGRSEYHMTGPNGESSHGYWELERVVPGELLAVRDGFANPDGTSNDTLPSCTMEMRFEAAGTGSRLVTVTRFPSLEAMERMLAMGMLEGLREAMGQIDGVLLSDLVEYARGRAAELELEGDTTVVVTRVVRGSIEAVWRAHNDAAVLSQWLLGPDGWMMPVCEVAAKVGDTYRYEWAQTDGAGRFGFTGELLESEAPRRAVTTERMIDTDGPSTTNELTLVPKPGGRTQITNRITYPSRELRDTILGTGMVGGMETSYARLERTLDPSP